MVNKITYYLIVIKFLQKRTVRFLKSLFRQQTDFEREIGKENSILKNAAQKLDIRMKDWGGGMLELKYRGKTTFIKDNTTEIESAISHKIAGDKYLVSKILEENNLPVPSCECFTLASINRATQYFLQMGKPVVVKPRRGTSGGTGVTAGISNLRDFRRSFYEASLFDKYVLVEEFVPGENIRLLILEDQLLSAVKRIPAYVVGDGRSSIKKLIRETNHFREQATEFPKLWPILINNDLHLTLKRQKLSLGTVLPKGKTVFVKTLCNGHQGGIVEEVTSRTHPDYIQMSVRALQACKVKFGGVDFIVPDISKPFSESGGVINEINTTPSFYGHYQARNQEEIQDAAEKFLRYLFQHD